MYQDKTMLVTGATKGIGKEIVNYFASKGVNIIMTYYSNKQGIVELEKEIKSKYHVNVDSIHLELENEESIKKMSNYVKTNYNKIDYLINNAALSLDNYLFDKTKKEFMSVLEVNVVGTFLMMKYFDSIVDGFIFNISSTDGIDTGSIYSIDYNVSKAAINSISKTFSLESKNTIISICPNWVDVESTRNMDSDYLKSELKRINQDKLISVITIPKVIDNCITKKEKTGSIIRIEGDNRVRRIN